MLLLICYGFQVNESRYRRCEVTPCFPKTKNSCRNFGEVENAITIDKVVDSRYILTAIWKKNIEGPMQSMIWKSILILNFRKLNFVSWVNFTLKDLTKFCQFHPKHSQTTTKFENRRLWCDEQKKLASSLGL